MNEEEAIEKIKWSIQINNATKEINGDNTSINVQVLETVLNLLEKKDKQIDEMAKTIKESHFIQSELDIANAKIIKLNKMIDLMADKLVEAHGWFYSEFDNYTKEDFRQYFERKIK